MDTKNVIAEKVYTLVGMCRGQGFGVSMQANSIGNDIINLLKEQEEKKKGQWIPIESPTGVEAFGIKEMTVVNVRCSVCGSEEDVSFTGYKYCPRCGAKMEGK